MNRKFISKSNRVLRKVLNSEKNLEIIKDFIEAFLEIEIQEIKLNPYLKTKYLPSEENFGIADVRIKLVEEELNIGIQIIDGYHARNKMLLYYAQIHTNQIKYQDSRTLSKTVTINIMDFIYLKSSQYLNKIEIPSKINDKVELYIIELPKFVVNVGEVMNKRQAWMTYLCGKDKKIAEVLQNFDQIKKLDNLLEEYWEKEVME